MLSSNDWRSRPVSSVESGDSEIVKRVRLAAAPSGPALQELGTRGAEHEQRNAPSALDELVDEVEQRIVRPVQILEHEHHRPALGQCFEVTAPGCRALLRAHEPSLGQTGERTQVALDPLRLRCLDAGLTDRAGQLLTSLLGGVGLEDARFGLDDLAKRPEGHAVAVWKRATLPPADELGAFLDCAQ